MSIAEYTKIAIAALITYGISHTLSEYVKWWWSARMLRYALVIESVASINKMETILSDIIDTLNKMPPSSTLLTPDQTRQLACGYISSPPTSKLSDLITLGRAGEAELVLHFLDRWKLFSENEVRYSKAFDQLLNAHRETAANELAIAEYSSQALNTLKSLREIVLDLIIYSFRNIHYQRFTAIDCVIRKDSGVRWYDWKDFEEEKAKYDQMWKELNPSSEE